MRFSIYRYNPEVDSAPRMQDYDIALEPTDRMLLDALIRIKEHDDSLSLRRSCREGVCGSDAMNINGKNGLACITKLADVKEDGVTASPDGRDLGMENRRISAQRHQMYRHMGESIGAYHVSRPRCAHEQRILRA